MAIITCTYCQKTSERENFEAGRYSTHYCNRDCLVAHTDTKIEIPCGNCGKITKRKQKDLTSSKSGKIFCSQSCSASYNNRNKTTGCRRSKLEVFIEERMRQDYPNLTILTNDVSKVKHELDFYLPDIHLAIELNGILHYSPIYGQDKLSYIKTRDLNKTVACFDAGIELAVIDTSSLKYMKKDNAEKFYQICKSLIDKSLSRDGRI